MPRSCDGPRRKVDSLSPGTGGSGKKCATDQSGSGAGLLDRHFSALIWLADAIGIFASYARTLIKASGTTSAIANGLLWGEAIAFLLRAPFFTYGEATWRLLNPQPGPVKKGGNRPILLKTRILALPSYDYVDAGLIHWP